MAQKRKRQATAAAALGRPVSRVETFSIGERWGWRSLDLRGQTINQSEPQYDSKTEAETAAPRVGDR